MKGNIVAESKEDITSLHNIKTELVEKSEKELRDFAISSITTTEKYIDLANKLTHDINANNLMAESCVMSTINGVGLIKLINNNITAHNIYRF